MPASLAGALRDGIVAILSPLAAAATPDGAALVLRSVGRVGAVADDPGLRGELIRVAGLAAEIEALDDSALDSWDGIGRLVTVVRDVVAAVQSAEAALSNASLAADAGALGADLAERLVALHLRARHTSTLRVLELLGLVVAGERVDPEPMQVGDGGTVQRLPWPHDTFHPGRLGDLVSDAGGYFAQLYLPGGMQTAADAHAGAALLFPVLVDLANLLGLRVLPGFELVGTAAPDVTTDGDQPVPDFPPPEDDDPAPDLGPLDPTDFQRTYRPTLGFELLPLPGDTAARIGLLLTASSGDHPDQVRGYLLTLAGGAGWQETRGHWQVSFTASGDIPVVSIGPGGLRLGPGQLPGAEVSAAFALSRIAAPGEPALRVGAADGSHIEIGTLTITAGLALSAAGQSVRVSFDAASAFVVLNAGGDGLLASLLPDGGLRLPIDAGVTVDSATGVHLRGGVGLSLPIQTGLVAGPLSLDRVTLALVPDGAGLGVTAAATMTIRLGPFTAVVDGLGLRLRIFQASGAGVLGPVDAALDLAPPSGVGIAVDAAVVHGGGFLGHDPATGRYSGVVDLHAGDISIIGLGLLDTHVPGGGYALLVALQATFPAIEIGFGFALTGVGGLVALNRRIDVDTLRARLAAGTAGRILAPQDPIRNAPALLADLDAVFPIARGVTVVGPTAQLTWVGLVHFDIGVFLELPGPTRVVLLGSAHAEIERDGASYLTVHVDVVGVIDLRARTCAFDAVLTDSHILGILDITGGAAFRLSWGEQPYAVLSLGGFNPAYHPEPLAFPKTLTRIAMVHGTLDDEVYLRFEGYLAVTSNTLQFGAAIDARINSGGFTIRGTLGFDALIQFTPFHFQFDIRASVDVQYHGHSLAGLTLTGSLTGPGPVVLHAKVCIELLFFDICFSHTFTLGSSTPPPAPGAGDLLALLLGELSDPARLRAGGGADTRIALRPTDPTLTLPLIAPVGALVWEQHRAPLGLLLTRLGGAPLAAPAQVNASSALSTAPITDWFAPGQFADLSDAEALTRPAYDRLASGLAVGVGAGDDGPAVTRPVTVRQLRIPQPPVTRPGHAFPPWLVGGGLVEVAPLVAVGAEDWTVRTDAGAVAGLSPAQARHLADAETTALAFPTTDLVAAPVL
jgi:hypothetical protein